MIRLTMHRISSAVALRKELPDRCQARRLAFRRARHQPEARKRPKASAWKDASHEVEALLDCLRLLNWPQR